MIPEDMMDEVMPVKEMIDEAVANTNDDLLEKFLNEETFTKEEISWALRQGVMNQTLIPVLCGTSNIGIQILLNSMVAFFPAAGDTCNSIIVKILIHMKKISSVLTKVYHLLYSFLKQLLILL